MTLDEQNRVSETLAQLSLAFIDGLKRAAIEQGMSPDQSARIADQVVAGSVALLQSTGLSASALVAQVASPGGTTEAGLAVMEGEHRLDKIVAAALANSSS